MKILVTNDDGYTSKGILTLAKLMCQFGSVTVIAPKHPQSGMAMAVSLGLKQIAYKHLGIKDDIDWSYLDATPASCVKYGLNVYMKDDRPDIVVCGINHGLNASTAACYSGTLGAASEAAVNGIPAIGVSLDEVDPEADFSPVERFFPELFEKLAATIQRSKGIIYNVNFPAIDPEMIKGIRVGHMGKGHWIKEFIEWDPNHYAKYGVTPESVGEKSEPIAEEGEKIYMMTGEYVDDDFSPTADNHLVKAGFISVTAHNIDNTDYDELKHLQEAGIDKDFQI